MLKLLNNLPIEDLNEENDYLGIIDKGEIIKTFLENNTDEFRDIKMFSLYGEWGSGKSTLMKYLQNELKGTFNTFFFEAWQFESDDNLSLSLLEYLSYKSSDSTEEALGELVEIAAKLFRGFSKSIRITVPGLSIDGSKIVESLEEQAEETFYQLKKKFQVEFRKWESHVTRGKKPKFNIVFIDDLDRCEPENVLNLLSALKLFFTYGERTIFFCGIDKKAVNEAVKTKYNEIVKANEYLEKIFDISFNMPVHDEIFKLVDYYFKDLKVATKNEAYLSEELASFFKAIDFTNPRKLKKVLNKYIILNNVKHNLSEAHPILENFPNLIDKKGGSYFETIVTLYFILLLEFYPKLINDLFDVKQKHSKLFKVLQSNLGQTGSTLSTNNNQLQGIVDMELGTAPLKRFLQSENLKELIFIFLPSNAEIGSFTSISRSHFEKIRIQEKGIEYRFIKYLLDNSLIVINTGNLSGCSLESIRNILERIV